MSPALEPDVNEDKYQNLFSIESKEQLNQRLKLRSANTNPTRPDPSTLSNLDGSIKKNTGFIKKIKAGITAVQANSLKKDLLSLKLEKYLEEVASSIAEGTYKTSADVWTAVEICSMLHYRFENFMDLLKPHLLKSISTLANGINMEGKEKEEQLRIVKERSNIRLFTELYLVGLLDDGAKLKEALIPKMLFELLARDKEHLNINLAVTFVKFFSIYFLPDEILIENNQDSQLIELRQPFVTEPIINETNRILNLYFNTVKNHLVKEHQKLQKQEKSNQESFIARGEISEDRQEAYEKRLKLYEKFKINTQSLSTYLFLEMPELPKDEETTRMTIGIVDGRSGKEEKEGNLGAWENEEMKVFYEQILDLANQVPGVLLGKKNDDESKQSEEASVQVEDIIDADVETPVVNETEEVAASELPPAQEDGELKEDLDTDVPEIKGESTQATFTGIVNRMLNALNREAIDSLAVEFAFVNNKGTRKQLIQALLGVSRQRLDLLPYYSRLIATLNPYFPDVGSTVVAELERSFHYHQKKKEQVFIEEKLKNIRFIGELTKFKVTPSHIVFHCLKVLLEDFNFHNVEITCSLLETCGRFLYFNPETNVRTANFLDILLRKKTVLNMDPKYAFMIDNAVYECNPPETSGMVQKHREPIELFLRKLVYKDLSRSTIDVVLKLLRKVDWNDDSIRIILNKLFFKTWKIKFSNLHLMAFLVSELSRYYPDFGIGVVDNTLESIRIGLEHNQFKHNQRRLASMKFLGELYNYRMVDSTTIFETLYLLIRFGHENGIPLPNVYSPLDAPDDFFRLRLACTLLDACGACFRKGSLAKKLDDWLVFMQMYIFTKDPVPIDTEFFVMETIEMLRPKMEFISNYEQAVYMVNSIARSQLQQQYVEPDDDNDNDLNDTMAHENVVEEDGDPDVIEEKDDDEEEEEVDQDAVVHMKEQAAEEEEDELFAREFGRLMQQSIDSRKNERKTVMFDAPVPTRKAIEESQTSPQEGVTFSLLTRKGNKQQVKQMVLPSNSSFAIRTLSKQQAEQEERGRLKELVLNYEERERLQAEQPTELIQAPTNTLRGTRRTRGTRILWSNSGVHSQPNDFE
ncbi:armadillo-type protein [Globomyces pollinis-pini]|nr:armadillo-type protein [Globomyces pollinis-pini]